MEQGKYWLDIRRFFFFFLSCVGSQKLEWVAESLLLEAFKSQLDQLGQDSAKPALIRAIA